LIATDAKYLKRLMYYDFSTRFWDGYLEVSKGFRP